MLLRRSATRSRTGLLVALLILSATSVAAGAKATDCHIGLYRLSDRSDVDIAPSDEGKLRWRRKDGTSGALTQMANGTWRSTLGWTERPDGKQISFTDCADGGITFDGVSGTRVALDVIDTHFQSDDARLAGRLVMPTGRGRVPVVVLIHGSERDSALDFYSLQRLLPSAGIGTFVYDKRGTGTSGGSYTQDYHRLAADAVVALGEARRLAGSRVDTIGYQAGSQGGWVAPLAATMAPVDFVIIGFGLAVSPIEEDRSAVVLDMTRRGFGPDVVTKALEVADATEAVIVSNFTSGFDRLDAVRRKYDKELWFRFIHGNVTFFLLENPEALVREQGPVLLAGALPHYDPMPVLRALKTPQLWIFGEDDLDAPGAETIRRLQALNAAGKPIITAVFPRAEHGILEYETRGDGKRLSTRNPDGYFTMMRDYILHRRLTSQYGSSHIHGVSSE